MKPESASQINQHEYAKHMALDLMGRMDEIQQAERIAKHYLSHATSAQVILKTIDMYGYGHVSEEAAQVIKMLADEIKINHAHDLGIELSWNRYNF